MVVLQVSLPFMVTPGCYPAPEHTWTGRGRSQTSSQHLRPLLPPSPPPIASAPVTQSFVLINRSRPQYQTYGSVPLAVPAASQALTKCGYNRRTPHHHHPQPMPSTHAFPGERKERRVRRSQPVTELGKRG